MRILLQSLRKTLTLLEGEPRWYGVILVIFALGVAAMEALGAMLIFALMGLIATEGSVSLPVVGNLAETFPDTPLRTLQLAAALSVAGFFLLRSAAVIGQEYVQQRIVNNTGARLASRLMRGYLAMPYMDYTRRNSAELIRNAFDSVQTMVRQVMRPLVNIVAQLVLVVGMTTVLLILAPMATLLAVAVLGPGVWLLLKVVQPRLKTLGRASQEAKRGSLHAMQQGIGGLRDIRLLGREDEFTEQFARHRHVMARAEYVRASLSELPRALIETSLVLVIVAVFVFAMLRGQPADTVVSTLGVFAYAGMRVQPSLRDIVQGLNNVRFGSAVIDDLLGDVNELAHLVDQQREDRRAASNDPRRFSGQIELRDVSFSYSGGDEYAVDGVDLTIRAGEFIGICGPTGGGKSTLVDLIAGLLPPTRGQVLVDGQPLAATPSWWFSQVGMVSQSIFLVDDTVARNIAFGWADDDIDMDRLDRALRRAQLEEVIAQLPLGLDTVLGERGIRLSGGQRQRVAIARALYLEPPVIIFDEGTSALDSATEAALVRAVGELRQGRTLISVAHRISTVREADRIIVVADGSLVDQGTHDELQARSSLFRTLTA